MLSVLIGSALAVAQSPPTARVALAESTFTVESLMWSNEGPCNAAEDVVLFVNMEVSGVTKHLIESQRRGCTCSLQPASKCSRHAQKIGSVPEV